MTQPPPYDPNAGSPPSYPPPSYPPPAAGAYGNAPAYGAQPGAYPPAARTGNGIAIGGFVVSLVSILFTGLIGLFLAVVAGVLSFIGLQNAKKGAPNRGLALAGVIISAVVVVLSVLLIIIGVGILVSDS